MASIKGSVTYSTSGLAKLPTYNHYGSLCYVIASIDGNPLGLNDINDYYFFDFITQYAQTKDITFNYSFLRFVNGNTIVCISPENVSASQTLCMTGIYLKNGNSPKEITISLSNSYAFIPSYTHLSRFSPISCTLYYFLIWQISHPHGRL